MDNLWLKIKFWTKLTITGLVALYLIIFIAKNSQPVEVWYWYKGQMQMPKLLLVAASFVTGIVTMFLIRTTFRTIRQVRDLTARSRTERLEREMEDMKSKAAMLQTRSPTTRPTPPADDV